MTRSLVLIELDAGRVRPASLRAIGFARTLGPDFALLLLGRDLTSAVAPLTHCGAREILLADHDRLAQPLADRYAHVIADAVRSTHSSAVVAAVSTFSKDILPRAAALLDAPMLSDVVALEPRAGDWLFRRPVYAGSRLATCTLNGPLRLFTVRASAFSPPDPADSPSPVRHLPIDAGTLPDGTTFVSREARASVRPDLEDARVVVAGGRPLRDTATFEKLIGGLADRLGAAVGSTRAAVDAGIVPNDLQIGQTGRVIAADLYIAVGISGSIQHLAGVKDCRVIVAINKDPEAPMVKSATYSLIGDLYEIVPQLLDALPPPGASPK